MLQRNLLYTGITRAKRLLILVGSREALAAAVRTPGRRTPPHRSHPPPPPT
ncbi:ATP-binding domain-containing protein [Amycolatopsis sp. cmx-4-83]|uniref:ATP-binding domain-containing protein n=1 Tax=Amycolatopsis sp. cmx-4-83 TaxID=2790940 RepID=UPI003978DE5C